VNRRFEKNDWAVTPEFEGKSKEDARGIAVDLAVEFSSEDYEEFQTSIQAKVVEEPLAAEFPGLSRIIVGKIDLEMPDTTMVDLKTSKRAKGQSFADTSQALSTYGMLRKVTGSVAPCGYDIHNLIQGKKGVRTEVYHTTRTEDELMRTLARFKAAMAAIDAGNFIPCSSEHWKCSEAYCGFYNRCQFGGGKI